MAYLARIETQKSRQAPIPAPALAGTRANPDFSPLEWSFIRLARGDSLATIREPSRIRRFYRWLIGRTGSPMLANPRLEALRRIAVLSWQFGFSVPGEDVADFLSA